MLNAYPGFHTPKKYDLAGLVKTQDSEFLPGLAKNTPLFEKQGSKW